MAHAQRTIAGLLTLLVVLGARPARAQPAQVELMAASTEANGKPEVRLAWRIGRGWLTAEGLRLYELEAPTKSKPGAIKPAQPIGTPGRLPAVTRPALSDLAGAPKKRLVSKIDALDDDEVARIAPELAGAKLASTARSPMKLEKPLDFSVRRAPSAAAQFKELKGVTAEFRALRKSAAAPSAKAKLAATQQKLSTLTGPKMGAPAAGPRPGAGPGKLGAPAMDPDAAVFAARSKLHMLAMLRAAEAPKLGLGATDKEVTKGETVTYALYAVVGGKEQAQPLDTVTITVGADDPPPAPTGIDALQDEERVALRWERVPEELERKLLAVSYVVQRRTGAGAGRPTVKAPATLRTKGLAPRTPGGDGWEEVTRKPLVILDNEEGEAKAFFSDTVDDARDVTYRVALRDGFGRQSAWTELKVNIEDWRHPGAAESASARLRADSAPTVAPGKAAPAKAIVAPGLLSHKAWKAKSQQGAKPEVVVSWRPPRDIPADLHAVYRIYRIDADDPEGVNKDDPLAKAQMLTPTPVEGSVSFLTRESDADEMAAAMGQLPAFLSIKSRPPADLPERVELRSWSDTTCTPDEMYRYLVVAEYKENGFLSEPADAGVVGVPDSRPPRAVRNLAQSGFEAFEPPQGPGDAVAADDQAPPKFGMSGVLDLKGVDLKKLGVGNWQYGSMRPISLGGAGGGKTPGLTPRPAGAGPAARSPGPSPTAGLAGAPASSALAALKNPIAGLDDLTRSRLARSLQLTELRQTPRNDGGRITISWSPGEDLRGQSYRVRRRLKTPDNSARWDELGTVNPGITSKADVVPRARRLTYEYEVAPVSRWGVLGSRQVIPVEVPSTLRPSAPNLLTVAPDGVEDGAVSVRLALNPAEESVKEYLIYRTGKRDPVAVVAAPAAGEELAWTEKGLSPGAPVEYSAVARSQSGWESPRSELRSASPIKATASTPKAATWRMTGEGALIEWEATDDVVSYIVRRRLSPTSPPIILAGRVPAAAGTAKLSISDRSALAGRPYIYEVIGVDGSFNQSPPAVASAAP